MLDGITFKSLRTTELASAQDRPALIQDSLVDGDNVLSALHKNVSSGQEPSALQESLEQVFSRKFQQIDRKFYYRLDDNTLSNQLVLADLEWGFLQRALKQLKSEFAGKKLETGFVGVDQHVDLKQLVIAKPFGQLIEGFKQNELAGQFREGFTRERELIYANILARVFQDFRGHKSENEFLTWQNPSQMYQPVKEALAPVVASNTNIGEVTYYQGDKTKPLIVLLPDIHGKEGVSGQEDILELHRSQAEIFKALDEVGLLDKVYSEGPIDSEIDAEVVKDPSYVDNNFQRSAVETGEKIFLRGKVFENNKTLTLESTENIDLFIEQLVSVIVHQAWLQATDPLRASGSQKSIGDFLQSLSNLMEGMPERKEEIMASFNDKTERFLASLGIRKWAVSDFRFERFPGLPLKLPNFKHAFIHDPVKVRSLEKYLARLAGEYTTWRSKEILGKISSYPGNVVGMVVGAAHVPEMFTNNINSKNPASMLVINPNKAMPKINQWMNRLATKESTYGHQNSLNIDEAIMTMTMSRFID